MTSTSFGFFRSSIFAVAIVAAGVLRAETPAGTVSDAKPTPALAQHSIDKLAAPAIKALKLENDDQQKQVSEILGAYFQAVDAWQRQVEPQLAPLWSEWSEARSPAHQDETKAAGIAAKIDAVYAQFRPQHDQYVGKLAKILSPAQVETVENALTREPGLERTYNAFLQIVPTLTPEQKASIHDTLVVARDQALDTLSKKEKINLFKKQKVKVQLYIQSLGYDWKKVYSAYAKKLQEEGKKEE